VRRGSPTDVSDLDVVRGGRRVLDATLLWNRCEAAASATAIGSHASQPVNPLGRARFDNPDASPPGHLRHLRSPDSADEHGVPTFPLGAVGVFAPMMARPRRCRRDVLGAERVQVGRRDASRAAHCGRPESRWNFKHAPPGRRASPPRARRGADGRDGARQWRGVGGGTGAVQTCARGRAPPGRRSRGGRRGGRRCGWTSGVGAVRRPVGRRGALPPVRSAARCGRGRGGPGRGAAGAGRASPSVTNSSVRSTAARTRARSEREPGIKARTRAHSEREQGSEAHTRSRSERDAGAMSTEAPRTSSRSERGVWRPVVGGGNMRS
jgi:hypothetical protein